MSHTKGPWVVGYGNGITGPRCAPIAYIPDHVMQLPIHHIGDTYLEPVAWVLESSARVAGDPDSSPRATDQMQSDARLIAAAPDLYEACALFQKWNREVGICDNCVEQEACCEHHEQMIQHACALSKAAIAKATGGTQ